MTWRFDKGWCRDRDLERRIGGFIGVTTRALGDMDRPVPLRKAFRRAGLLPDRWASGYQVHGKRVQWVSRPTAPRRLAGTDGFLTRTPGLALCIRAADCVPIFVADPHLGVISAVHAGWRGVRKGILTTALHRMRRLFGCRMSQVRVSIGPHIQSCCYEIGTDVARLFGNEKGAILRRPRGRGSLRGGFVATEDPRRVVITLNMTRCLRREAIRAGVPARNITASSYCTFHDRRFFSYRRNKTEKRMAGVIALKP